MERENYDDFQNAINSLVDLFTVSFNDMTMNDVSDLRRASEEIITQWEYLNKDIEHLFNKEEQ